MFTSAFCNTHMNASEITWKNIKDELQEVVEAKSIEEFKGEVSDVLYFVYCAIESKTGVSLPMYGAERTIKKVWYRLEHWKKLFANADMVFDKKYLLHGSNHDKPQKVMEAFKLAIDDQQ